LTFTSTSNDVWLCISTRHITRDDEWRKKNAKVKFCGYKVKVKSVMKNKVKIIKISIFLYN